MSAQPYVADSGLTASEAKVRVSPRSAQRFDELDFVKGTLVLFMVLYHWLNYFIGLDWDGYRYLRFLTPSFIFITGFLVSHAYLQKFAADDPQLRRRLVVRGLKLLALFVILNVGAEQLFGSPRGVDAAGGAAALVNRAKAIFLDGRGRAAFDILVSIAYFLVAAPFVVLAAHRTRVSLWAIALATVVTVAMYGAYGHTNPHLEMVAIAMVGLAAGATDVRRLDSLANGWLLLALYAVYVVAIALWDALFPLQVFGVTLTVMLIYRTSVLLGTSGVIQSAVVRMGRYSLLSYIVQIAVLQILRRLLRNVPLEGAALAVPLVATLAMTVLAVELTGRLRQKSGAADRLYRAVFA